MLCITLILFIKVFKGENPTSKPNSKIQEKTPLYIVVVIIILGALIFGCCCIVIVAFRWKKKRKAGNKSVTLYDTFL